LLIEIKGIDYSASKQVYVVSFYVVFVVSMQVSILYGILLLQNGMYGKIRVSCLLWKDCAPNGDGFLHDLLTQNEKVSYNSPSLVFYGYGVVLHGSWLRELVCGNSLLR